jgi:Flp pilus assembly protein CpaB
VSTTRCPSCRRALALPDRLRAAAVQCPACGATFEAPRPPVPAPCQAAPPGQAAVHCLPPPVPPARLPVSGTPVPVGTESVPPTRLSRKRLARALLVLLPVALLGLALAQRAGNRQSLRTRRAAPPAARRLPAPARPGAQAVTIQVTNVAAGVGGFVLPGRKVDVLLTLKEGPGGGATTTVLQNVEVLAVDQRLDIPPEAKLDPKERRLVTLLVSPREATLLAQGQKQGTLRLSLRNPDNKGADNPRPLFMPDLRFRQEKPWDQRVRKVQVPKGMRAYTIQTPSLAAGVAPGERVDVLLTVGHGDQHPIDFRTFTLLKDVQILAVERAGPQANLDLLHRDSAVTLLVSPGQAARLTRADRMGALDVVSPSRGDGEVFPPAEGHLPWPEEEEPPPR